MQPDSRNGSSSKNGAIHQVRYLPASYDSHASEESALPLIFAVRPDWDRDDTRVEFVRCTDGITNTLLKVINRQEGRSKEEIDQDAILLRAYGHGSDILIDRQRETQNHELLMQHGLAPELLARFENGMLYRYIRGTVTSPADLRKPHIYRAVARRLAQWHATVPCISSPTRVANGHAPSALTNGHKDVQAMVDDVAPGKPPPNVWTVMQKWILALPNQTEEQKKRQARLQAELRGLVEKLSSLPGLGENALVFAHCDLLSGNVIVLPGPSGATYKGDGDSEIAVHFIDYEYGAPSPAAFDIANHFAEWGGFDCDYRVLPTRAERQDFVREYIRSYFDQLPEKMAIDEEVETAKLLDAVDLFRGVPGFYWGIWALIQAVISEIDFDYASYAETRLGEFWAWKAEMDGSRVAAGEEMPLREKRWAQAE